MGAKKLARLNAYQLAAVAAATSTGVALAVVLALRRFLFAPTTLRQGAEGETPAARERSMGTTSASHPAGAVPHHFSEQLLVPGLTQTGEEVLSEDMRNGRSREGV